jgi:hypothetical protein
MRPSIGFWPGFCFLIKLRNGRSVSYTNNQLQTFVAENDQKKLKGERKMAEHEQRFVWVKDKAGNEYVCRVMDLKDPKKVDDEDLKNCIDDASRAIPIGD